MNGVFNMKIFFRTKKIRNEIVNKHTYAHQKPHHYDNMKIYTKKKNKCMLNKQ